LRRFWTVSTAFQLRVAALSLLFDTLDSVVTGFVLASLRTVWNFEIGLSGYLVGSFFLRFSRLSFGREKTILFTLILYSFFSAARGLAHTVAVFAVLNFFAWVFIGAESSTVPPYLAELCGGN
jgi:putative MFS transporter